MPDNTLSIGAIVEIEQLKSGMDESREAVKRAVGDMAIEFNECAAKTKLAMRNIGEDVRAAAQKVSYESFQAATATQRLAQAQMDVRRANIIAKDSNVDAAESTALLAAAQDKARAAALALAETQKSAAVAAGLAAREVVAGTEEMGFGYGELAVKAREAFAGIQEGLVVTAEKAEISADGIAAGFGGLGKLLGVGIAGELLAHMADDTAEAIIKIGDLSKVTNISVQSLAGLQAVAQGLRIEFPPITQELMHMGTAQVHAQNATNAHSLTVKAFTTILGENAATMELIKHATPEEMFTHLSKAIHGNTDATKVNFAMREIFGRGAAGLTVIMKKHGDVLDELMKKEGEKTGYTQEAYEASEQLMEAEKNLSLEIHRNLIPVIEHALPVLQYFKLGFVGMGDYIAVEMMAIRDFAVGVAQSFSSLGAAIGDASRGQWKQMLVDARESDDSVRNMFRATHEAIVTNGKSLAAEYAAIKWTPQVTHEAGAGSTDLGDLGPEPKNPRSKRPHDGTVAADLAELDAAKENHRVTVQEELNFWVRKQEATRAGSAAWLAIQHRVATLRQEEMKQDIERATAHARAEVALDKMLKPVHLTTLVDYNALTMISAEINQKNATALQEAQIHAALATGKISEYRAETMLAAVHTREYNDELARLKQELDAIQNGSVGAAMEPKERAQKAQQVQDKIQTLQGKQDVAGVQDGQKEAQAFATPYESAFGAINNGWTELQSKMIMGTHNIGLEFRNMCAKMVADMATHMAQIVLKSAEGHLITTIQHRVANQANLTSDTETTAASTGIQKAGAIQQAETDAKGAAVKAFKWGMDLPEPFNWVVAPAAAAAAFTGALAFAAFEHGGIVGGQHGMAIPILAHAGERVLTPHQTVQFERMVSGEAGRGGGGSPTHIHQEVHFHGNTDQQFRDQASRAASHLYDTVQSHFRRTGGR